MTPQDENAYIQKAEAELRGHRMAPNGRNFLAFTMRFQNNEGYKDKFDSTFSGAPGSDGWFKDRYCEKCGKNRVWCSCGK